MPLDKVLIRHLDDQDALEEQIDKDVEDIINQLDVNDLLDGAEDNLMAIVEAIQARLKDFYYEQSAKNGIQFAKNIVDDGDIQIPKSQDPNLNEGVVSGSQGETQSKS